MICKALPSVIYEKDTMVQRSCMAIRSLISAINTHTPRITQVDKKRTFYKALEPTESQSYRHICNCAEGRTTGLQYRDIFNTIVR